jgi:hypothetical protein
MLFHVSILMLIRFISTQLTSTAVGGGTARGPPVHPYLIQTVWTSSTRGLQARAPLDPVACRSATAQLRLRNAGRPDVSSRGWYSDET